MEIATGALSSLLPKLGDLLKEEYELQKSARREIIFLKAELESMQAALLKISDAPMDQPLDAQVKLWARGVRELSYDVEDIVDTFMVRVDDDGTCDFETSRNLHGLRCFIGSIALNNLVTKARIRHNITTEIRDIKSRIKEVSERHERYKVNSVAAKPITSPTVDCLRLSALYKKAADLIGTERKSDDLVSILMGDDDKAISRQQLKIVSIVGFGGLGKTTLAKIVYEKLKGRFHCGAFVSVSPNPNMISIFNNMLHQLGNKNCKATWGEAQLIHELREFLRNKRYFIVVDDIWSNSVWKTIQYAIIQNECGSRIITTTRIHEVANQAGCVYELQPLSPADSRKLFYLGIFGAGNKCPSELSEVSENILKKCGGVPLAIITTASMLANKTDKENTYSYWLKVYKSMGSGLECSQDMENMRRILSVSYYDLPAHLKTCLLYLCLYPEDHDFNIETLIWKWVGEGFLSKEHGKAMYDVGRSYVNDLINRSMIQIMSVRDDDDRTYYFRVNAMVRDLITFLSNEEHFLTAFDGQQPVSPKNKVRRLSLQNCFEDNAKQISTMSLSHVRSLTVFRPAFSLVPALLRFPILRVLDLNGCYQVDNHYCKYICNMFHLRYLGLRSASITEIPKEIGKLQFLQVLNISDTCILELPSTFAQLRQLVCLHFDYLKKIPDGFGNLKYLQELNGTVFVDCPVMLQKLSGLIELRRLILMFDKWDESYNKPFLHCLSSLISLEHLLIAGSSGDFSPRCDSLTPGPQHLREIQIWRVIAPTVPRWMSSLSTLSTLRIMLRTLGEEDLQILGSIPHLSDLHISVKEHTQNDRENKLVIGMDYPFLCLKRFVIHKITGAVFAQGAMQRLQTLVLGFGVRKRMDQFGNFDFGLENLVSLVYVSVEMSYFNSKPDEVVGARTAILKAVSMNPSKPKLQLEKPCVLKVNICCDGCKKVVMQSLVKTEGVSKITIDPEQGSVIVSGGVDPTSIINKLNKAGVPAELWGAKVPTRPMRFSVMLRQMQYSGWFLSPAALFKVNQPDETQSAGDNNQLKSTWFKQPGSVHVGNESQIVESPFCLFLMFFCFVFAALVSIFLSEKDFFKSRGSTLYRFHMR